MIAQTNKCLQFHTACISQILEETLIVRYLSTNEKDNIPIGPQVKLLNEIGRDTKRRRCRRQTMPVSVKATTPQQGNRKNTYCRDKK